MKTKEIIEKISRRKILVSVIMLVTLSTTANNFNMEVEPIKESMFVFYLTGILFFTLFLLYVKASRSQKNVQVVNGVIKALQSRRKQYNYRRLVKRFN
ncbi:MAG: hypothetical protein H0W73_11215 [Bacteroidetes bacterium]|nr:hypothetical protein [Bacteroidota bacterium]